MNERSNNYRLLQTHIILFSSCVLYILLYGKSTLTFYDEFDYFAIARNLAFKQIYSIDGQHLTAFRAPVFPFFLSVLVRLGCGITSLKIVNSLLLVGSSFILSVLLERNYGRSTGVSVSILVLLYPVLIYTAGTLYPQMMGSILLVSTVFTLFWQNLTPIWRGIILGTLLGLLVLTIPTLTFLILFICLWLIYKRRDYKVALICALVAFTIIGLWVYRNYNAFDKFIFVSTNSGINLLRGNSEYATPNSGTNVDINRYIKQAPSGNEAEIDVFYRNEALRYISENKGHSIALYFQKVLNNFNFRNDLATANVNSWQKDTIMFVSYALLLILLGCRVIQSRNQKLSEFEHFSILLYTTAAFVQAIFFTRIRFRIPFDFLLIAVSSISLTHILDQNQIFRRLIGRSS